jgi:hypothetical protein
LTPRRAAGGVQDPSLCISEAGSPRRSALCRLLTSSPTRARAHQDYRLTITNLLTSRIIHVCCNSSNDTTGTETTTSLNFLAPYEIWKLFRRLECENNNETPKVKSEIPIQTREIDRPLDKHHAHHHHPRGKAEGDEAGVMEGDSSGFLLIDIRHISGWNVNYAGVGIGTPGIGG